jgi:hypothetical protein
MLSLDESIMSSRRRKQYFVCTHRKAATFRVTHQTILLCALQVFFEYVFRNPYRLHLSSESDTHWPPQGADLSGLTQVLTSLAPVLIMSGFMFLPALLRGM